MLSTPQGQEEINRINTKLRELAGIETYVMSRERMRRRESVPARLPAIYYVELEELFGNISTINSASDPLERTYYLRLMRQEQTPSNNPLRQFMEGAKQIISEDTVTQSGNSVSSDLKTFISTTSLKKDEHYLKKGFGSLLIHVLIYCCACANVQMKISAIHQATIAVYRKYKPFACKFHEIFAESAGSLDDSGNIEDGIFMWRIPEQVEITLNASSYKLPTDEINISSTSLNPLTPSHKENLKTQAIKNITALLTRFAKDKESILSANIYIV